MEGLWDPNELLPARLKQESGGAHAHCMSLLPQAEAEQWGGVGQGAECTWKKW